MGDNVTINDVAVCFICKALDPTGKHLVPKEVCGRYVSLFLSAHTHCTSMKMYGTRIPRCCKTLYCGT